MLEHAISLPIERHLLPNDSNACGKPVLIYLKAFTDD